MTSRDSRRTVRFFIQEKPTSYVSIANMGFMNLQEIVRQCTCTTALKDQCIIKSLILLVNVRYQGCGEMFDPYDGMPLYGP